MGNVSREIIVGDAKKLVKDSERVKSMLDFSMGQHSMSEIKDRIWENGVNSVCISYLCRGTELNEDNINFFAVMSTGLITKVDIDPGWLKFRIKNHGLKEGLGWNQFRLDYLTSLYNEFRGKMDKDEFKELEAHLNDCAVYNRKYAKALKKYNEEKEIYVKNVLNVMTFITPLVASKEASTKITKIMKYDVKHIPSMTSGVNDLFKSLYGTPKRDDDGELIDSDIRDVRDYIDPSDSRISSAKESSTKIKIALWGLCKMHIPTFLHIQSPYYIKPFWHEFNWSFDDQFEVVDKLLRDYIVNDRLDIRMLLECQPSISDDTLTRYNEGVPINKNTYLKAAREAAQRELAESLSNL